MLTFVSDQAGCVRNSNGRSPTAIHFDSVRYVGLFRKGCVQTGLDADLVVLGDLGRVQDVMARGRWHVRDGQVKVFGTYENE